jgi:flagellar hook-associated protein 3 FlgL
MRITQNMLNNTMLSNLNNSMTRMDRLQDMLATGKKVSKPSHNPIVAVQGMMYRTNLADNEQFKDNTNEASSWLQQTETSISEGVQILLRVKELLTQAANDTNSQGERQKIAEEVSQLKEQMGTVANTTFADRYIFSGTQVDKPAYDTSTGDLSAAIDNNDITLYVSQTVSIPINVTAENIFGSQGGSTSIFKALDSIVSDLNNSNTANIQGDLNTIQGYLDKFLQQEASVGARQNRIELMQNRLDSQHDGTEKMLSDAEDADMAKVIMDLQNEENVHRAALSAGSRIIQTTLLDFLR